MSEPEIKFDARVRSLDNDEFFGIGKKNIFVIPKYQRPYTWEEEQCKVLFDDITQHNKGYFLGSMLCVEISNYEHAQEKGYNGLEVVDGQQRLTTLGIFFLAIYKLFKEYEKNGAKVNKNILEEIKKLLIVTSNSYDGDINFSRIFPQTNKDNRFDYLNLLEKYFEGVTFKKTKEDDSDKKIQKAFECFQKCLKDYVSDEKYSDDNLKCAAIFEIYKKLKETRMVRIVAEDYSEAYVLFEALNDRGVPLKLPDLIKNQLLARLSEQTKEKPDRKNLMENNLKYWDKEIVGKIPNDNRTEQERFFRQIYNAFRFYWAEKYPNVKFKIAERSNLLKVYLEIINGKKVDIQDFISDLRTAAKFYSHIQVQDETLEETKESFADLRHIEGSPAGTLLIYLLKNKECLNLNDKNFASICEILCKLFIRRSFTGIPRSNNLDDIFMDFIKEIEDKSQSYTSAEIEENLRQKLKDKSVSDEIFIKELHGDVYTGAKNDYRTRFILEKIAAHSFGDKTIPNFWEKAQKQRTRLLWSIEHILPQKLDKNGSWIAELGCSNENDANAIKEQYVHKLGNLTLTKYNSELSNNPFLEKRDLKDAKEVYIGYKDFLSHNGGLNSYVVQQDNWTPKQIDERTDLLVKEILKIFAW